jgi:glycosyltransferase involved in cell wall biosynthesis
LSQFDIHDRNEVRDCSALRYLDQVRELRAEIVEREQVGKNLPALGIAITTYNRAHMVMAQIDALQELTSCNFELVVCDDGSTDMTVPKLRDRGVKVISGINRGVAWNKNRGLFYLREIAASSNIVLMDDDIIPTRLGWQDEWIESVARYGHMNFKAPGPTVFAGKHTPTNPALSHNLGGACIAFSREAISYVGYMDTRFHGYGHEHTDLTMRAIRAGFGGFILVEDDRRRPCFYSIEGGLALLPSDSNANAESVARNGLVLMASEDEPIYRNAWRTSDEYKSLRSEIGALDGLNADPPYQQEFHAQAYLAANPDVAAANWDAWHHFTTKGWQENRPPAGRPPLPLPSAGADE